MKKIIFKIRECWKDIQNMCHMLSVLFLNLHGRDYYSIFPINNALIETVYAPTCPPFAWASLTCSVFLMSTSPSLLQHYPLGKHWESFQKVSKYFGLPFNKKHTITYYMYSIHKTIYKQYKLCKLCTYYMQTMHIIWTMYAHTHVCIYLYTHT